MRSAEGQQAALELLRALAEGYRLLCLYRWGFVALRAPPRAVALPQWRVFFFYGLFVYMPT